MNEMKTTEPKNVVELKPGEFLRSCENAGCVETGKSTKKADGEPSIPKNWKQFNGHLYCPKCASKLYHIRAVTFRMKGPVNEAEKTEFFTLLRKHLGQVQMLKNWLVAEYKARDIRVVPGMERLPKWECPYLYREATALFPELSSQVVVAVDNIVKSEYAAKRLDALWFRRAQFPEYGKDQPMPIPARSWNASYVRRLSKKGETETPRLRKSSCQQKDPDGHVTVPTIVLPLGSKSYRVELKAGKVWWPQMETFNKIVEGTVIGCQLLVLPKDDGFHLKLVAWFPSDPRKEQVGSSGKTMLVTTDSASLLVFTMAHNDLQRYNGDQFLRWSREEQEVNDRAARMLRRWQQKHDRRLMRLREDNKTCRRIPSPDLSSFRQRLVEKHRRRMKTGLEKIANIIVNKANQCRCDTISFVLTKAQFLPHFPWYSLRQMLEHRVSRNGMQLSWVEAASEHESENQSATETVSV